MFSRMGAEGIRRARPARTTGHRRDGPQTTVETLDELTHAGGAGRPARTPMGTPTRRSAPNSSSARAPSSTTYARYSQSSVLVRARISGGRSRRRCAPACPPSPDRSGGRLLLVAVSRDAKRQQRCGVSWLFRRRCRSSLAPGGSGSTYRDRPRSRPVMYLVDIEAGSGAQGLTGPVKPEARSSMTPMLTPGARRAGPRSEPSRRGTGDVPSSPGPRPARPARRATAPAAGVRRSPGRRPPR